MFIQMKVRLIQLLKKVQFDITARTQSVSVITAISKDKFLSYEIMKDGTNAEAFGAFFIDLVSHYMGAHREETKVHLIFG